VLLSLVTLPLTIVQLKTLFGFDRPALRLDYLVLLWAVVPWLWRQPEPFAWLHLSWWRSLAGRLVARLRELAEPGRRDPDRTPLPARREMYARVRAFLGLRA
jgi:hypothetical protein